MSGRVAVTTIVRGAGLEQPAGWLRVLSLDTGEQLAMSPLPDALHRALDTNPRGGLRGGRGLASTEVRLAVAINDRILVLDSQWRVSGVLSCPWMGGIHDIVADSAGLWVACSDNDLVLRVDWDGRVSASWHWRSDRSFRRALGFGWLPGFDRSVDHRHPLGGGLRVDLGHVNAVAPDGGALLVGFGMVRLPGPLLWPTLRARGERLAARAGLERLAAAAMERWRGTRAAKLGARRANSDLTEITPGWLPAHDDGRARPGWSWAVAELREAHRRRPRARLIARHPAGSMPTHNVGAMDGWLVVNDSARGRVVGIDRTTGAIVRSVQLPGHMPFPRGLLDLGGGRLLVGTQTPAALYVVDLARCRVVDRVPLPDDRGESPYAIATVPACFGDPILLPGSRAAWGIAGGDASRAAVATQLPAATC